MNSYLLSHRAFASLSLIAAFAVIAPQKSDAQIFVSNLSTNVVSEYDSNLNLINTSFISADQEDSTGGFPEPTGLLITGNNLFVANQANGIVSEYDATTGATINSTFATVPPIFGGSGGPNALALDPSGNLLVATENDNTVYDYNIATGKLVSGFSLTGLHDPMGLAVSGTGSSAVLYVANALGGGSIGEYNANTGAAIKPSLISNIQDPFAVSVVGNELFVLHGVGTNENISAYSLDGTLLNDNVVTGLNNPYSMTISGNTLYVTTDGNGVAGQGEILEYNLDLNDNSASLVNTLTGLTNPGGITVEEAPEPSSLAMIFGSVGFLAFLGRRKLRA